MDEVMLNETIKLLDQVTLNLATLSTQATTTAAKRNLENQWATCRSIYHQLRDQYPTEEWLEIKEQAAQAARNIFDMN